MSPLRIAFLIIFLPVVCLLGWKLIDDHRASRARGRFVASILDEQLAQLSRDAQFLSRSPIVQTRGTSTAPRARRGAPPAAWPDDSIELQRWLVSELVREENPAATLEKLQLMSMGRALSPRMIATLQRWSDALNRWALWQSEMPEKERTSQAMLEQGRWVQDDASGFRMIGRGYDATPLYVCSCGALLRERSWPKPCTFRAAPSSGSVTRFPRA
jgi:hypothetical protein